MTQVVLDSKPMPTSPIKSPFRVAPVLQVIGVVGLGGLVFALYLPLLRAHAELRGEYQALALKVAELDDALQASQAALDSVDEHRERLQAEANARTRAANEQTRHLADMVAPLEQVLTKPLRRGSVLLTQDTTGETGTPHQGSGGRPALRITFLTDSLFYQHSYRPTSGGQGLLCATAKQLATDDTLHVAVVGHAATAEPTSAVIRRDFQNSWQATAGAAGIVATELTRHCGFPEQRLRLEGVSQFGHVAEMKQDGVTLIVTSAGVP